MKDNYRNYIVYFYAVSKKADSFYKQAIDWKKNLKNQVSLVDSSSERVYSTFFRKTVV